MAKRHSHLSPVRDWRQSIPKGYVRLSDDQTRVAAEAIPPTKAVPLPDLQTLAGTLMVTRDETQRKYAGRQVLVYLTRAAQNRSGMAPCLTGKKVQPKKESRTFVSVGPRQSFD